MGNKLPLSATIYLTDYCYLCCNHCFFAQKNNLNKNHLDFELFKKLIDDLCENQVFMAAYTGGDPLLHPNFWEIIELTSQKRMLPLIGLSGMYMTSKIAKRLAKTNIGCVQIGLNGSNSLINDKYRGVGSFNIIKNSIKLLQKYGVRVNLAFCIDKVNFSDYKNMIELAYTFNAYKVKIEYWYDALSSGGTDNELSNEMKSEIAEFCKNFEKNNNKADWIYCPLSEKNLSIFHRNSLIVMPNGDIKYHENEKEIGNLKNTMPSKVFNLEKD